MKKRVLFISLLAMALGAQAQADVVTLDLTKAAGGLTFDETTGAWSGTNDDDETSIESQCFEFSHTSYSSMKTWFGFTASNSADNSDRGAANWLTYQFSNMAEGGIVLNADGTVKKNDNGSVAVSAEVPYLVCYPMAMWGPSGIPTVTFTDGNAYEAVGMYVNLNSYAYYSIADGLQPARAFTEGDAFTLTITGVGADETEKTVDVKLASFADGDLTVNRGWKFVDLSSLGVVNELKFMLNSTDKSYGYDNTPDYFCLDKLMVRKSASGINTPAAVAGLTYDKASARVTANDFVAVYDVAGVLVASGDNGADVSTLPAGVYVARSGNASIKFVR